MFDENEQFAATVYDTSLESKISMIPAAKQEDTGLTRIGSLQKYLSEIRKYPLLTAEERYNLFVRYKEYGDLDAAMKLATSSLRLVVKISMEYHRTYMSLLDLIQEGNIGLLKAIEKFDPYKGTKFSTYAAWWIRAYILKFIIDNWSLVKFATSNEKRKLFFNLKKERDKLEAAGYRGGPRLLAEHFDVPEQDVIEASSVVEGRDLSLDAPVGENKELRHIDLLSTHAQPPDEKIADDEYQQLLEKKLKEFTKRLNEKEQAVFKTRLIAETPKTLQEIGDMYGITRERVRQLEERILKQLKGFLSQELPYFKGIKLTSDPKDSGSEKGSGVQGPGSRPE